MTKSSSKKSLILSVAMLTIMVLGMGSSVLIFQQARLRYSETPEAHMLFNMGQYEFELQRTTEALVDVTYNPENKVAQANFEKWFNILWSRTSVLDQGAVGARMASDGFDLVAVKQNMKKIDLALFRGKETTTEQYHYVRTLLKYMSDASHRFIVKRESLNRQQTAVQWEKVFSAFRNSIILGVISFVLGLFVATHLYRNNTKLRNLRGTLEDRVNKRTEELQLSNFSLKKEITERYKAEKEMKKSQAAAEDANKAKSEFLAIMSHEIRTPLAGIIGMSELLLNSGLKPQQLDWSRSVKVSGQNLLSILNDILDQSKLEFGKFDFDPTDFHLASFIEGSVQLFSSKFDEKRLSKVVELEEGLPTFVKADSLRFGQILSNLLSNAIKFTNTGGITLRVFAPETTLDGTLVKVEVRDTGIGFSKEIQSRLFTPFQQGDSSTSRMYGGTGLGLSISKQLVEAMGGEIGVESKEGVGTTFWFTIPCEIADEKNSTETVVVKTAKWTAARPLKILLAEDNFINQKVIVEIFSSFGHDITVAENGRIAVDYVLEECFDVILMDIRMPEMDGLEATQIIRSMENDISKIPIIAVTADIASGSIERFLDAGMNDVCSKPLELPKLLVAINKCLNEEVHVLEDVQEGDNQIDAGSANKGEDAASDHCENAPTGDSIDTLLQKLERVSDREVLSIAGIDDETTALFVSQYEELLEDQCKKLKASYEQLSKHPTSQPLWHDVSNLIHSLKGDGGTYGYLLVSQIATGADDVMKKSKTPDQLLLQGLDRYIHALILIGENKLSGNGGDVGQELLNALETNMR